MKKIVAVVGIAALASMSAAEASTPAPRTVVMTYTQLAGDFDAWRCDSSDSTVGGVGGVCFTLRGDETSASEVVIRDDSGLPVGGMWEFSDAIGLGKGDPISSGSFCGRASNIPVPATAVALIVYIDGPIFGPMDCLPASLGIGTHGRVQTTFTLRSS